MQNKKLFLVIFLTLLLGLSGCAKKTIDVRLDGATDAVTGEIFGKIVKSADGVVSAKRKSFTINPENSDASKVLWQVTVDGVDSFHLQTEIMSMAKEVIRYGGNLNLLGVPYRYSEDEISLLLGLKPHGGTAKQVKFVIDRTLMRDREFSGW